LIEKNAMDTSMKERPTVCAPEYRFSYWRKPSAIDNNPLEMCFNLKNCKEAKGIETGN